MCHTVLAKYVLDKWKNALPVLRNNRLKKSLADRYHALSLKQQALEAFKLKHKSA